VLKGLTGYNSCDRCTKKGYYTDNRVIHYSKESYEQRTDNNLEDRRCHLVCLGEETNTVGFKTSSTQMQTFIIAA